HFRPDRARQLTWAFMQPDFAGFARGRVPRDLTFATMTEYKVGLPNVLVAFPPQEVVPMAQILADDGLMQFHTAETEKYAHVTYFFNGGREERFAGEDRELVPSQKVATYDVKPEMSAPGVAAALARAVRSGKYDFAIVNLANPDMVGHTGDFTATLAAMEATDRAVGEIVDATLVAGGCVLLTADHGNAEAIAAAAVMRWIWAITLDGPVLYGEGAVAHAALLARQGAEYVAGARYGDVSPIFTAANYPPLYFHIAGLGDPFIAGRIASGVAT